MLFFARQEAGQLGHASVESEELVVGVIRDPGGVAGQILAQFHISLEDIRKEIKKVRHPSSCKRRRPMKTAWEPQFRLP